MGSMVFELFSVCRMRSIGCSCLDLLSLDTLSSAVGRPHSLTLGQWDSGTVGQWDTWPWDHVLQEPLTKLGTPKKG